MALDEMRMTTGKIPIPFDDTRITILEAFFTASVILLATRFQPLTRFLALVQFVIGIFANVTSLRAIVAAFKTNVARHRTFCFRWIFSAIDLSGVFAEGQDALFRHTAHCSQRIDVTFEHRLVTAFVFAYHPDETFAARLVAALLARMAVFADDLVARLGAFESIDWFTAVDHSQMLTIGENFFHFDRTVDISWRFVTFHVFLKKLQLNLVD